MIPNPIEQISEAVLHDLIKNKVTEQKTIEYKSILKLTSEHDRKEFLADVSSFANAAGGDLIFGIKEDQGIPKDIPGIDLQDTDALKLKLEQILANGLEPRLPSIALQPVQLANNKHVLIIRIGKSWISPHRVTLGGHDKFYSRNSAGKFPMDVSELRISFNLSETLNDQIRRFREDRISKIQGNEMSVLFEGAAKIVMHLIPLVSFRPGISYNIMQIAQQPDKLPPLVASSGNSRINFEGLLTYTGAKQEESLSITQLYRTGIIEAIDTSLLMKRSEDNTKIIPSTALEIYLIRGLEEYLAIMKTLGVELPVLLFLTFIGIKSYFLGVKDSWRFYEVHAVDQDILLLPEVIIEDYAARTELILRPCFDVIWNACGYKGSFNYDDKGNWKPDR